LNNQGLIEQLEFLHSVIFPAAYNLHTEHFPGLGACRMCAQQPTQEITHNPDLYMATQKRVLEPFSGVNK
jgi:hypothetical protein